MARTIRAAIEAVAGPEFDAAVGFVIARRRVVFTDPEIAAAFSGLDPGELRRIALGLAARQRCHPTEADDAVQDGLLELWSKRPELFRESASSWLGLLHEVARRRLQEIRPADPALSSEALFEDSGDAAFSKAEPCLSESYAADEEGRHIPPPAPGKAWDREQVLGAIQRFRDYHGRPPKAVDFKAINALPSLSALYRHFDNTANALLAAGMVPESGILRRRHWPPIDAARECRAFRRRNARWPSWRDVKRRPGELPSTSVMIRYFGGTRSIDVQMGSEAILEARGEQTA